MTEFLVETIVPYALAAAVGGGIAFVQLAISLPLKALVRPHARRWTAAYLVVASFASAGALSMCRDIPGMDQSGIWLSVVVGLLFPEVFLNRLASIRGIEKGWQVGVESRYLNITWLFKRQIVEQSSPSFYLTSELLHTLSTTALRAHLRVMLAVPMFWRDDDERKDVLEKLDTMSKVALVETIVQHGHVEQTLRFIHLDLKAAWALHALSRNTLLTMAKDLTDCDGEKAYLDSVALDTSPDQVRAVFIEFITRRAETSQLDRVLTEHARDLSFV